MIAMVFHKQYVRQQQKLTSLDLQERCVAANKPKCNKTFITTNKSLHINIQSSD